MEPGMSDFKRHWAAKHKVAQSINSCAPCALYLPIIKTLQKKGKLPGGAIRRSMHKRSTQK